MQRVILIVLDGCGIGELPDAATFGDVGAATLQHVAAAVGGLKLPHLQRLGLGNIAPLDGVEPVVRPAGGWGRLAERGAGKDSVTGHWELMGVIQQQPFAVFPAGFPDAIIEAFVAATGLRPLGNLAASGTEIIKELGEEHLQSGRPIVYTSADSVFQIAAHEEVIPPEQLYEICRATARILLPFNVCRVIARPFVGSCATDFERSSGRHDFPRAPDSPTLLDRLQLAGIETCGVGKIEDLFAHRGLDRSLPSGGNRHGMERILEALSLVERGLIFANLVDFDMLYGHRLDAPGFARALEEFDRWLPRLQGRLGREDLLIISADHGCDPSTPGTDHSREYVPLLVWSPAINGPCRLQTRASFADVAASIAELFAIDQGCGTSFLSELQLA